MIAEHTLGFLALVTVPACMITYQFGRLAGLKKRHSIRDARNALKNWWDLTPDQLANLNTERNPW